MITYEEALALCPEVEPLLRLPDPSWRFDAVDGYLYGTRLREGDFYDVLAICTGLTGESFCGVERKSVSRTYHPEVEPVSFSGGVREALEILLSPPVRRAER